MMSLALPPPAGASTPPVWNGTAFLLDGAPVRVLAYDVGESGWSDELASFHEDVARDDHFIDVASRRHVLDQIGRHLTDPHATLADIGCSSGYLLRDLRRRFPDLRLIGADFLRGTLDRLAPGVPGIPLLQFDLTRCPLPSDSLDAIVLLNVLEHIRDDRAAIRQIHRILKPGGIAVVEVPAGSALYDGYDEQLLHHRRYGMPGLLDLLREPGFEILERSYLGCLLYPAFYLAKKLNQKRPAAPGEARRRLVGEQIRLASRSSLAHGIMRLEAALRGTLRFPFGIRCLVTGRKPAARTD